MAETPGVSGLAQIFRTGWEVQGFHSMFDYIVGSTVMQHQAEKAMSGWAAKVGDSTASWWAAPSTAGCSHRLSFVTAIHISFVHQR